MESDSRSATNWDRLSWDLTELILSYLPLRSLISASAVCRHWRFIISHPSFPSLASASLRRLPWFFLSGQNNVAPHLNRSFGFDPDSSLWVPLPPPHPDAFAGAGGFSFAASSSSRFAFSPLLVRPTWQLTPPLSQPRCNPVVAVFDNSRFVVVGGARFLGGLVDVDDMLAVEIYDPAGDRWELGPPFPAEFRSGGSSSQWFSAALLPGRGLFFIFGIYSCHVAAFDLKRRAWVGPVRTLRPQGALFAFLIASLGDRLVLAGLCNGDAEGGGAANPYFAIWAVDHRRMEPAGKTAVLPAELLTWLFGTDDDESRFASLKCVGSEGMVYVFNEDHHKGYPACVCEIDGEDLQNCKWRKVPPLPSPVNRFHKTIAFCSPVPMSSVLSSV